MSQRYKYKCINNNHTFANRHLFAIHGFERKMRRYAVLLVVLVVLFSADLGVCLITKTESSIVKVKEEPGPGGLWQTKVQWKAHWVKHWETRKVWIPVWRKIWGPVEVKEWIPLPKPPPTWTPPPHSTVPY